MKFIGQTLRRFCLLVILISGSAAFAQQDNNNNYLDSLKNWSLPFQFTTIVQEHTQFNGAGYDGHNTLSTLPDTALSVTTTLFLGCRLWRGAAVYVNPELAGGRGIGHNGGYSIANTFIFDNNTYAHDPRSQSHIEF